MKYNEKRVRNGYENLSDVSKVCFTLRWRVKSYHSISMHVEKMIISSALELILLSAYFARVIATLAFAQTLLKKPNLQATLNQFPEFYTI